MKTVEIQIHPVKEWMQLNNMTSVELGKKAGISESYIRKICRGENVVSKKTARKVSTATGIPPEVIMFDDRYIDFDVSKCKPE